MRYVVYLTKYSGQKLPPYYIGSTNIEKINNGYFGSIRSKKWKFIFDDEIKNNINLFSIEILSYHNTRREALIEELRIQIERDVVKSDKYFNQSLACINGFFGMDVKGKNHPMFAKNHSEDTKKKISESQKGKSFEDRVGIEKAKKWREKMKLNTFTSKSKKEKKEIKNKISSSLKTTFSNGRIFTEEWKNNMSKARLGIKPWNYGANIILQLDMNDNLIKEWNSFSDIKKELNLAESNLCKCCKGERKSSGGFKWKYK